MNISGINCEAHPLMTAYDIAMRDLHAAIFTKSPMTEITRLQKIVVIARNDVVAALNGKGKQ